MTAYPIPTFDPEPTSPAEAIEQSVQGHLRVVPDLAGFHELRIWAESYDDMQKARIACVNRMERGGVPPEVFAAQIAAIADAEHQLKLALGRCYRRVVPAGIKQWQESEFGIGAHLLARLLGALGHPRIATPYHWEGEGADRCLVADEMFERSLRQLWTYCGHGEALRRRKGMSAEEAFGLGSPRCKMLVHLLATGTIKTSVARRTAALRAAPTRRSPAKRSSVGPDLSPHPPAAISEAKARAAGGDLLADQPIEGSEAKAPTAGLRYRGVYDQRRAHTAVTHPEWTPGHSHNDALRIVGKEILRDLWIAADPTQPAHLRAAPKVGSYAIQPAVGPDLSPHPPMNSPEADTPAAGGDLLVEVTGERS